MGDTPCLFTTLRKSVLPKMTASLYWGVMTLKAAMASGESTGGTWFMYSELMKKRTAGG